MLCGETRRERRAADDRRDRIRRDGGARALPRAERRPHLHARSAPATTTPPRSACGRRCATCSVSARVATSTGSSAVAADLLSPDLGLSPARRVSSPAGSTGSSTRRVGVVRAAARGGASDQPSRGRTACSSSPSSPSERGGLRALRPRLDRVRRRHPLRPLPTSPITMSPRRFATRYEQSKFEAERLVRATAADCRRRSSGRASSSATATAAGRRRSTSCTGRCARSRAGCTPPCPPCRAHRSTSSRSTSSPTRSTSCASPERASARPTTSPPARTRAASAELVELASHYFKRPPPRVLDRRASSRTTARDADRVRAHRARARAPRTSRTSRSHRVRQRGRAGAGWSRSESLRRRSLVPRAAARLRHPQPVGQTADRPLRGGARLVAWVGGSTAPRGSLAPTDKDAGT